MSKKNRGTNRADKAPSKMNEPNNKGWKGDGNPKLEGENRPAT